MEKEQRISIWFVFYTIYILLIVSFNIFTSISGYMSRDHFRIFIDGFSFGVSFYFVTFFFPLVDTLVLYQVFFILN